MILIGFNPDQQEEEEDPPAPSNSRSGPFIAEQKMKTMKKQTALTARDKHGSLIRTKAGTGL